ncbi:hypothetical protein P9112_009611 [Eukaryota sp. TZLM1-RC]
MKSYIVVFDTLNVKESFAQEFVKIYEKSYIVHKPEILNILVERLREALKKNGVEQISDIICEIQSNLTIQAYGHYSEQIENGDFKCVVYLTHPLTDFLIHVENFRIKNQLNEESYDAILELQELTTKIIDKKVKPAIYFIDSGHESEFCDAICQVLHSLETEGYEILSFSIGEK